MSEQPYDLLRAKIEEIFQIDRGDLDFGIYRILRIKSAEMRRFLGEDLPRKIEERFGEVRTATAMRARRELQEKREALLDMGQSEKQISATPVIMELEERLRNEGPDGEEVARAIYSDLFNFFRRYYRDGDFISERRYGGEDKYMLSHTGEEVRLHWANYDQYYIKSSENFSRYVFLADDGRRKVVFRVARAETEQNDNKDQNGRRLLVADADDLRDGNPIEIDENIGTLTVHFAFKEPSRELNGKRKSGKATQADCDGGNVTKILASLPEEWKAMLNKSLGGDPVRTLLEKHVGAFSARNRFDYFIHKDLGAFLRRELDFFLKNEVMILSDVADASPMVIRSWMNRIRLTQEVGNYIIDMLAQLEEFQKKLWLKKKFVLETNWLAAWRFLSDDLQARVLENEAQTAEWKALYDTTEPAPHTLVDTKHFDSDFKEALLSHVGESHDIDDICDGVLVNGDNFHGLRLLENRYREQVKCIYIDPPYNTSASEIIYKNGYKHSSWITLMENRVASGERLLSGDGSHVVAIDDTEFVTLSQVLDQLFKEHDRSVVVVNHHPAGAGLEGTNISATHEYAIFMTPSRQKVLFGEPQSEGSIQTSFLRTGTADSNLRAGRPNSFYCVLVNPETSEVVGLEPPPEADDYPRQDTGEGFRRIYPVSDDGTERVWRRSYESCLSEIQNGNLIYRGGKSLLLKTSRAGRHKPIFSNWTDKRYNAGVYGTNLLKDVFGGSSFSYPKSVHTVKDCVNHITRLDDMSFVFDYFAGSGTTGHAVVELNREDGRRRKFILMEMGEYFDTVLVPRIKKVSYSPEWKDGKPKRPASEREQSRSPRLIKVQRTESYEDALDNLKDPHPTAAQQKSLDDFSESRFNYIIRYMLDVETRDSPSLLDIARLDEPMNYALNITREGKTSPRSVDLVETFNYLLGLKVQKQFVTEDVRVVIGETLDGRRVLILWRSRSRTDDDALGALCDRLKEEHGKKFAAVYANGDCRIDGVLPTEYEFRRLMFEGVE